MAFNSKKSIYRKIKYFCKYFFPSCIWGRLRRVNLDIKRKRNAKKNMKLIIKNKGNPTITEEDRTILKEKEMLKKI